MMINRSLQCSGSISASVNDGVRGERESAVWPAYETLFREDKLQWKVSLVNKGWEVVMLLWRH